MTNSSDKSRWTALVAAATAAVALSTSVVSMSAKAGGAGPKEPRARTEEAGVRGLQEAEGRGSAQRVVAARKNWFDSIVKSGDLVSQVRVLRFLIATEIDPKLLEWGKSELAIWRRNRSCRGEREGSGGHLARGGPETRDAGRLEEHRARAPHFGPCSHRTGGQRGQGSEAGSVSFVPSKIGLSQPECISLRAPPAAVRGSVQQGQNLPDGLLRQRAGCRKGCQAKP